MKQSAPLLLLLEPLEGAGMLIRLWNGTKFLFEKKLAHGDDAIAALHGAGASLKKITAVAVRTHIGSFSASRTAFVVAQILAAVRAIPIYFVAEPLTTAAEINAALRMPAAHFDYAREAHITIPKKP